MSLIHGFKLLEERTVAECSSVAKIYEHAKTKAKVLSMENTDENKVFGISFRTPPQDSSGVAHILEHSVLCGSEKYPVKEPFVELLKGSLQTFLNALTFPDKTCYPVASTNHQDFAHLVKVYLDAVFFPRLTENTLRQEGWHLEPSPDFKTSKELVYKGVVFNEMKGAYSSPEGILSERSQQSLFPDTPYAFDAGGDPACIPDLSFDRFMAFHKQNYHPSNAYAFFYGDDDPNKRLKMLESYFSRFEAAQASEEIPLQASFSGLRRVAASYAASDDQAKAMFTMNYGLCETADPDFNLRFHVLEHILIGLPSSPLRKVLIESGLGEDIAGVGLETDLRQMYFSIGLQGIADTDIPQAEALLEQTLWKLTEGIPQHDIEAALNSVEFSLRENNTGSYPRGLLLMFRVLSTWLYGKDPLLLLEFEKPLAQLKKELQAKMPVFETLIRSFLLENTHRSVLLLSPDTKLATLQQAEEKARLKKIQDSMSAEDLEKVITETQLLQQLQAKEDSLHDLGTIPRLKLSDLPRKNRHIPLEIFEKGKAKTLLHGLETNGLVYLDIGFDLTGLPDKLMAYVPLFGKALLEMGTQDLDYVALQNRIARKTGGIHPQMFVSSVLGGGTVAKLFLRGKATAEQAPELIAILLKVLTETCFDNQTRLRQLALEAKARFEQSIVPSGHSLVATRLKASMNESGWIKEQFSGVSALFFLRDFIQRVEHNFATVLKDIEALKEIIFSKNNLIINITARESDFVRLIPDIVALTRVLPDIGVQSTQREIPCLNTVEGLSSPSMVNYVGKAVNLSAYGLQCAGSAELVNKFLRTGYLWDKVRVQGGAYGAFSLLDRLDASLAFVSYRDPNIDKTLATFDSVGKYLAKVSMSKDDLEKAIIGTIGTLDEYLLPDAKGFASMLRHLTGITSEWRQNLREEVLAAGKQDFHDFAELAQALAEHGNIVVLGSDETLKKSALDIQISKVL